MQGLICSSGKQLRTLIETALVERTFETYPLVQEINWNSKPFGPVHITRYLLGNHPIAAAMFLSP